jgi:acyl-CoA reductase-like NAD-dependent aldehyde dehydrogenase
MDYFADNDKVFITEVVNTDARKSAVTFEPLGVIGSIIALEFSLLASIKICSSFAGGW